MLKRNISKTMTKLRRPVKLTCVTQIIWLNPWLNYTITKEKLNIREKLKTTYFDKRREKYCKRPDWAFSSYISCNFIAYLFAIYLLCNKIKIYLIKHILSYLNFICNLHIIHYQGEKIAISAKFVMYCFFQTRISDVSSQLS